MKHTWVYAPSLCANTCLGCGYLVVVASFALYWGIDGVLEVWIGYDSRKSSTRIPWVPRKPSFYSGNAVPALLSCLLLKCTDCVWIQQTFGQTLRKDVLLWEAKYKVGDVEPINESRELRMPLTRKERKVKVDWIMRNEREKMIDQQWEFRTAGHQAIP